MRGEELTASSPPTSTSPTSPGSNSTHTSARRQDVFIRQSCPALIDGHDNPDNANAGVSKILNREDDGGETELTCQQLCDVATSTKSYVIFDWPLRQKTGKRIRTFQSHMRDNGWDNVTEMSYFASDDMRTGTTTPLVARIRGLTNTLKGGGRWKPPVANCSVHTWMSLYDCIYKQGYEWKIDSNYEYTGLLEVLNELSSICGGGVIIREYQQSPRIPSEHWQPDADRNEGDGAVQERGCHRHRQRPRLEASIWIDGSQLQQHRRVQALLCVAKEADRRDDHGCAFA